MTTSWVPASERIPGVKTRAVLQRQPGQLTPLPSKVLLIGWRTTAIGAAGDDIAILVESRADVTALAGVGSALDLMANAAFGAGRLALSDRQRGSLPQIYAMPVAPAAGAAATITATFSGTATSSGEMIATCAGRSVTFTVTSGDTAATVAAAAEAALAKIEPDLPHTFGVAAAVVTGTAREQGAWGQRLLLEFDTAGVAGITVVIATGVTGTGAANVQNALDQSLLTDFDCVVVSEDDATTRGQIATHILDAWDFTNEKPRIVVVGVGGTVGTAQTYAAAIDDYRVVAANAEQVAGAGPPPLDPAASAPALPFEVGAAVGVRLFTQRKPNHNYNSATVSAGGRPVGMARATINSAINGGVTVILAADAAPGYMVDPVTTAVTDQTGVTSAPDTRWQPVELPKTIAYMIRQMRIDLEGFAQEPTSEETRVRARRSALTVLELAQEAAIITDVTPESVSAAFDVVGGANHLLIDLAYSVIVGVDIIPVTHRITR